MAALVPAPLPIRTSLATTLGAWLPRPPPQPTPPRRTTFRTRLRRRARALTWSWRAAGRLSRSSMQPASSIRQTARSRDGEAARRAQDGCPLRALSTTFDFLSTFPSDLTAPVTAPLPSAAFGQAALPGVPAPHSCALRS